MDSTKVPATVLGKKAGNLLANAPRTPLSAALTSDAAYGGQGSRSCDYP